MFLRLVAAWSLALVALGAAHAQDVVAGKGPSLKFDLGSGIYLNEDSSLVQEWTVINDPELPVTIDAANFKGVKIGYAQNYYASAELPIEVTQKVTAIHAQLVPIDVWNAVGRSFGLAEVKDLPIGKSQLAGRWRILSESETAQMMKFVVFIRRVRLENGTVISANLGPVIDEIRKLNENVSEKDIDPDASDQ